MRRPPDSRDENSKNGAYGGVPLERRFIVWTEKGSGDPEDMSHLLGADDALTWQDLLVKHRVVILAEAGSGKTAELSEQARRSAAAGRFTFSAGQFDAGSILGADRSGMHRDGRFAACSREAIKRAVRDGAVKLVIATDAACEGLNLQKLGTLINVDLPWNPSRLQQRIGRIQRFGQSQPSVDMLSLVYENTRDEVIFERLSARMLDRFDLFGQIPDVIEDEWTENAETYDRECDRYIRDRRTANAFDLRWGATAAGAGLSAVERAWQESWETCAKVISRRDVVERMNDGW